LGVILTSFALPNEVAGSIALINQERDVQYIQIPIETFLKQNITVSDQDIQAYYDMHQDQYKSPERVSVDYLELSLQDLMTQMQPSDADLNNFYKENINTYTLPAQWSLQKILIPIPENASEQQLTDATNKAKDILEKISSGTDFATLAQQNPVPESANDKSGAWVTLSQLPVDLQKPVSDLSKAGQNTDPIRINSGYLIVKATALKAAQVVPYDQVKDKVKDALVKQLAEEKFADLKEKLSNVSYEHPDTLDIAAKAIGMKVKTTPLFTLDKGLPDQITDYKKVREAAFSEDVLHSQNNSDVIQISSEKVVVIRDKEHVNAALLSLSSVRQQIVDILQKQKAEQKAQSQAVEMVSALKSGLAPDVVAQKYFSPWVSAGFIGRYSTKIDSAILFTAFRLPKPGNAKNAMYSAVKLPNGYAVVGVNAVRDGSVAGIKDQYEVFDEQLQNSIGSLEYKLYEKSLVAETKISNYSKKEEPERTFA
jgi:peptidyl-prolyl cis-trans isomerase D